MIDSKKINTYNDIKRAKVAYDYAKTYNLDNDELNFIFDFIADNNNKIIGKKDGLYFYQGTLLVKKN